MIFCGRHVVPTTLDPIPRLLRALPCVLAMNAREVMAIAEGDRETTEQLSDFALAENAADARLRMRILLRLPQASALRPSDRLALLAAVVPGRGKIRMGRRA
jgi:hypothetical protein